MGQRQYRHVCVTLHREGKVWKSDVAVNGVSFEGKLPGSIVDQLVDAGGELLSATYIEHHPIVLGNTVIGETSDDYERRHVLWFRFPLEHDEKSVQLESKPSS